MQSSIKAEQLSQRGGPRTLCLGQRAANLKLPAKCSRTSDCDVAPARRGARVRPACIPAGALQLVRGLGGHGRQPARPALPAVGGAGGCGGRPPAVPRAQRAVPLLPERRNAQARRSFCVLECQLQPSAYLWRLSMGKAGPACVVHVQDRSSLQLVQAQGRSKTHLKVTSHTSPEGWLCQHARV